MTEYPIQTYTGRMWDLRNPRADNVCLIDVAMSLCQTTRFTGHCKQYAGRSYTVGQHSVLVYKRVAELEPNDYKLQLAGLLHDAHEAYIGDVSSPLKAYLRETSIIYDKLDREHQAVIAYWVGLDVELFRHPIVKQSDLEVFATECRDLMTRPNKSWTPQLEPLQNMKIEPWMPEHTCFKFCQLFHTLRRLAHLTGCKLQGADYESLVL